MVLKRTAGCLEVELPKADSSDDDDQISTDSSSEADSSVGDEDDQKEKALLHYLQARRDREVGPIIHTRKKIIFYVDNFFFDHKIIITLAPPAGATASSLIFTSTKWRVDMLDKWEHIYEIGKKFLYNGEVNLKEMEKFLYNGEVNLKEMAADFSMFNFHEKIDFTQLLDLTEQILNGMVKHVTRGHKIKSRVNGCNNPIEIDFDTPFRRIKADGLEFGDLIATAQFLSLVEPLPGEALALIHPTFIIDEHSTFKLIINKNEVCNGMGAFGDSVAHHGAGDYVRATAGLGLNVDLLTMLFWRSSLE